MGKSVLSIVPREIEKQWVPRSANFEIDTVTKKRDIRIAIGCKINEDARQFLHIDAGSMSIEQIVLIVMQYISMNKTEIKV